MNILTINPEVTGGGANQIAHSLFSYYREQGHKSVFNTAILDSQDTDIRLLENHNYRNSMYQLAEWLMRLFLKQKIPVLPRLACLLKIWSEPLRAFGNLLGHEDFHCPGTKHLFGNGNFAPDVIHAHNLFGEFFDLRQLPALSSKLPFVWTLHDMWAFTGHCSYANACDRWTSGCGSCPDLSLPPAISRDGTAYNIKRKKSIYQSSSLYIATPSKWLMDLVQNSILAEGMTECRLIHNGVDQTLFKPGDRFTARQYLNIPNDVVTLLYAASGAQSNPYKDYETIKAAFPIIIERNPGKEFLFLCVGERNPVPDKSGLPIRVLPWVSNRADLAKYYQAADLFLHAANMENFPTTILEALSCGLPCVATDVGGISEQVVSGVNGCLVKPNDPEEMAEGVQRVLNCPQGIAQMSRDAAGAARGLYSRERMGNDYLNWFAEILEAA